MLSATKVRSVRGICQLARHAADLPIRALAGEPRRHNRTAIVAPMGSGKAVHLYWGASRVSRWQLMAEGIAFDNLRERDSALLLVEPASVRP